jgi:hypothetical protein
VKRIHQIEINDGRGKNDEDKFRRAETVEEHAGNENHAIFHFLRHKMVHDQKGWEKVKKEEDAAEYHLEKLLEARI